MNAGEVEPISKSKGRIVLANGYASHGETVRLVRSKTGRVNEVWLGGWKLQREATAAAEMRKRHKRAPTRR
jgi:hypothetical protein